jgi:predicted metal-binding membrane protein
MAAMTDTLLERTLRRDRAVALVALTAVTALAWLYTIAGAGTAMPSMPMMMIPMAWTPAHAALMLVMWAVMMMAMMLPSAAPMILLFATVTRKNGNNPGRATAVFGFGYILVWAGFSIAATAAQWGLEQAALLSPAMASTSATLAGSLLIATGVYQFTPLKEACLRSCRSPIEFLSAHWRQGPLVMGLRHGVYCLGCCWALMLTLFVGGVMNLAWIAGLALFVLAEKVAPAGNWLGRIAGVALIAWGGAIMLSL